MSKTKDSLFASQLARTSPLSNSNPNRLNSSVVSLTIMRGQCGQILDLSLKVNCSAPQEVTFTSQRIVILSSLLGPWMFFLEFLLSYLMKIRDDGNYMERRELAGPSHMELNTVR